MLKGPSHVPRQSGNETRKVNQQYLVPLVVKGQYRKPSKMSEGSHFLNVFVIGAQGDNHLLRVRQA